MSTDALADVFTDVSVGSDSLPLPNVLCRVHLDDKYMYIVLTECSGLHCNLWTKVFSPSIYDQSLKHAGHYSRRTKLTDCEDKVKISLVSHGFGRLFCRGQNQKYKK